MNHEIRWNQELPAQPDGGFPDFAGEVV